MGRLEGEATIADVMPVPERIPATGVDLAFYELRGRAEMVIGLECEFEGHLDEVVLARAGQLLLDVEPMLAFRLVPDSSPPHWERAPVTERKVVTVASSQDEYDAIRCSRLDAVAGAQVAVCLWRHASGDRLLVRLTHIVGDGVALQLVGGRLSSLYSALEADPRYRPSPGRLPVRDPSEVLASISRLTRLRAILGFARFMAPRVLPRRTHRLPLPNQSAGAWVPVVRRLPDPSLAFLSRYGKQRGATVNDVVLAAAYRALAASAWDATSALRIVITVDLRRWCLPSAYAGSIANLSSLEYPFLVRDLGRSFDETLARVSAVMRRRKRSRPGLAQALIVHRMVKNLPHRQNQSSAARTPEGRDSTDARFLLTLSNEGLLEKSRLRFGGQVPVSAFVLPPFVELPWLHICISGYDGALTLATVTRENGEEPAVRFLDALLAELPSDDVAQIPDGALRALEPLR